MTDQTEPAEETVTVAVNTDICIGAGQCEMLEDTTFELDDITAIAGIIGSGLLPRKRADAVIDTCPSGAIHIVHESVDEPSAEN